MDTPPLMPFATPDAAKPRARGRIERDNCFIHYEVTGDGPALIFAHGLGGNHLSWWQQVPQFCGRYTCVTFSHRGFAPSGMPPGGPRPKDYAGDLAALIAHLGLGEVRIVAQSMGGWTALDYTLSQPGRVKALVLAATSGPINHRQADPTGGHKLAEWSAAAEASRTEARRRGVHPALGTRAAAEQPALHFLYRAIDEMSASLDKEETRRRLAAARIRPPADLAAITAPTLWITGAEDIVFPSFVAPHMAQAMPRATHVEVAQAGHSAYFERAAMFNRIVGDFLDRLD